MLVCSGKDNVKNQSSFCFDIYRSYRISSVYLVKIWKTLENNLDVYMYKWMWLSQNNFILKKWSVKACADPEIFPGVERVGVREIVLLARGGGFRGLISVTWLYKNLGSFKFKFDIWYDTPSTLNPPTDQVWWSKAHARI